MNVHLPHLQKGWITNENFLQLCVRFTLGPCQSMGFTSCCSFLSNVTCLSSEADCYCDQICFYYQDCCSDVTEIGCHASEHGSGRLFQPVNMWPTSKNDIIPLLYNEWNGSVQAWAYVPFHGSDFFMKKQSFVNVHFDVTIDSINSNLINITYYVTFSSYWYKYFFVQM